MIVQTGKTVHVCIGIVDGNEIMPVCRDSRRSLLSKAKGNQKLNDHSAIRISQGSPEALSLFENQVSSSKIIIRNKVNSQMKDGTVIHQQVPRPFYIPCLTDQNRNSFPVNGLVSIRPISTSVGRPDNSIFFVETSLLSCMDRI